MSNLYIDNINAILEFPDTIMMGNELLKMYAFIDFNNLEKSYKDYLELIAKKDEQFRDNYLKTLDEFKDRIAQFFDRKEKGIPYFLDILDKNSKFDNNQKLLKLKLSAPTKKKDNKHNNSQLTFDF